MSFVRDDHSYTRGVGAVASMDAASPVRRTAASVAIRDLAQRDALMARLTLGRAPLMTSPATGTFGIRTVEVGSGGPKRPSGPAGGGGGKPPPPPPRTPRKGLIPTRGGYKPPPRLRGEVAKYPGSVMTVSTDSGRVDVKTAPPPKERVVVVGSGGPAWSGGANVGPLEPLPQAPNMTDVPDDAPPIAPPETNKGSFILYAVLGIGAWLLLTRK